MTTIDDINRCLTTYQDTIDQTNCIRIALGYPAIVATNTIACDGITVSGKCISKNYLILGGVAIALFFIFKGK